MQKHLIDYLDSHGSHQIRGLRLLLEYFYAVDQFEHLQRPVPQVISVFGSARMGQHTPQYKKAYELGRLLYENGYAVATGGSSGVMHAANRGVDQGVVLKIRQEDPSLTDEQIRKTKSYLDELAAHSVGLMITLPFEEEPNQYVGRSASFHYFAIRKMLFALLSQGFVTCEGGWGTRDEMFEILTLVQTGKAPLQPIIYLSDNSKVLRDDIEYACGGGFISEMDLHLLDITNSPEEAVTIINNFYRILSYVEYNRFWDIILHTKEPVPDENKAAMEQYMVDNSGVFGELLFSNNKVVVRGYTFKSFGYLRKLVEKLNGV